MRSNILFVLVGSIIIYVSACGPVESTSLIIKADRAISNAETVEARNKSPYEYYAAKELVYKAREEWGYSDFEYAIDYAKDARDLAIKGREQALHKEKEDPSLREVSEVKEVKEITGEEIEPEPFETDYE